MTKRCSKCHNDYPMTEDFFYPRSDGKQPFRSACKLCTLKQHKVYRDSGSGQKVSRNHRSTYRNTLRGYLQHLFATMVQRCTDPERKDYAWYGGMGVEVNFSNSEEFIRYVQHEMKLTFEDIKGFDIDRIDTYGHYEPGNIRFVTSKVNQNNRRNNVMTGAVKVCRKCKQGFPSTLDFFYATKRSRDGLTSYCKKCTCDYGKLRRKLKGDD